MRRTLLTRLLLAGYLVGSIFLVTNSAQAKPNPEAVLTCANGQQYVVNGFGRGETLHVVNSTINYVVVYARNDSASPPQVIVDVPGQRDRSDLVTCSAISPLGHHSTFTFQGFFTPRGNPHDIEF